MEHRDCDWCGTSFSHRVYVHCSSKCWKEAVDAERKSRMIGGNWFLDKVFDVFCILFNFGIFVLFSFMGGCGDPIPYIFLMCSFAFFLMFLGVHQYFKLPKR